jgi:hypothetical protein
VKDMKVIFYVKLLSFFWGIKGMLAENMGTGFEF